MFLSSLFPFTSKVGAQQGQPNPITATESAGNQLLESSQALNQSLPGYYSQGLNYATVHDDLSDDMSMTMQMATSGPNGLSGAGLDAYVKRMDDALFDTDLTSTDITNRNASAYRTMSTL